MKNDKKIPDTDKYFDETDLYFFYCFEKSAQFMRWSTGKKMEEAPNVAFLDVELKYKIKNSEVRGGEKFVKIPIEVIELEDNSSTIKSS